MKKSVTRWVIIGVHGLYVGQWLRKRDAIYNHCSDLGMGWMKCRKKGDRVIKAVITYKK